MATTGRGYDVQYVHVDDRDELRRALQTKTRLVWLETPTNPLMSVIDIAETARIVHEAGALLLVDNTFLSPYFQNPLDLGADFVLHSVTKYINGHSEAIGGALVTNHADYAERIKFLQKSLGTNAQPFDSFTDFQACEDISLPPARLPDMLEALQGIADSFGVQIASFGHAGDGNLHPRVVAPSDWTAERWHSELPRILAAIYRQTAALGGQLSGERGIGEKRRDFICLTVPPATLALMRAIKATLDPNGILNPDKILPD